MVKLGQERVKWGLGCGVQLLRPDDEGVCVSSVSCCFAILFSELVFHDAAVVAVPRASELHTFII